MITNSTDSYSDAQASLFEMSAYTGSIYPPDSEAWKLRKKNKIENPPPFILKFRRKKKL